MSATEPLTTAVNARAPEGQDRTERSIARSERWRLLRRRPGFIIGVLVLAFWLFCAIGGDRVAPYGARRRVFLPRIPRTPTIRSAPTRSAATCCRGS